MVFKKDSILPPKRQHEREHTGGVTGSARIRYNGNYYQLKPSIRDRSKGDKRRMKVRGTDRENIGEVIAARFARALLGERHAPEISTVYHNGRWHGRKSRIEIVSKYLRNVSGNLDEYTVSLNTTRDEFKEGVSRPGTKLHALSSISNSPNPNHEWRRLPIAPNSRLAETLAEAIAVSALVGDHDVNPGNMIVVEGPNGEPEVGRIDFGHAFNDLLHVPETFGGRLRDRENPIFDFFNRTEVAGAKVGGDDSKLWRDYEGFVPSEVLGQALVKLGSSRNKLLEGLQSAKEEIFFLSERLNKKNMRHLINSLSEIHHAITGEHLIKERPEHNMIARFFQEIERFIDKQAENAVKAGHMMQLQGQLNQSIDTLNTDADINHFIEKWQGQFIDAELMDDSGKLLYPWFRESSETLPFEGNLTEYVIQRREMAITDAATEASDSPRSSPIPPEGGIEMSLKFKQRVNELREEEEEQQQQQQQHTSRNAPKAQ